MASPPSPPSPLPPLPAFVERALAPQSYHQGLVEAWLERTDFSQSPLYAPIMAASPNASPPAGAHARQQIELDPAPLFSPALSRRNALDQPQGSDNAPHSLIPDSVNQVSLHDAVPSQETAPPPLLQQQRSSSSASSPVMRCLYDPRRGSWPPSQDVALLSSFKQHGAQWHKVAADINQAGGQQRTAGAAQKRYLRLKRYHAAPKAATTTSLSLSSSTNPAAHQKQRPKSLVQPAAAASSFGSGRTRWSTKEDETFASLIQTCSGPKAAYNAFCKTFPGTKRTQDAFKQRWFVKRRVERKAKDGGGGGDSQMVPSSSASAWEHSTTEVAVLAQREEERSRAATLASAGESSTPQATILGPASQGLHDQREGAAAVTSQLTQPTQTATTPDGSANDTHQTIPSSNLPSSKPSSNPQQAKAYSFEYLPPGGFLIRNLPPLYELHISKPTLCQIIKPGPALTDHVSIKVEDSELERPAAPFAFRMGIDGFVRPLALPPGTQTTISFIDDGEVEVQGGRGGQETIVETRFDVEGDGYVVVFRSLLRDDVAM